MPKLATPVQYEPSLEGLNEIRPLQLADESKIVIPYPVLCKNPPSTDRPAVGMFARCSNGALLKSVPAWAKSWEYSGLLSLSNMSYLVHFTFAQRVYGVLARYAKLVGTFTCYWNMPSYSVPIKRVYTLEYTFLPFVGKTMYFKGYGTGDWEGDVWLYGFY